MRKFYQPIKQFGLLLVLLLGSSWAMGQTTSQLGGGVIINEAMADPNGANNYDTDGNGSYDTNDEFIELHNFSAGVIDITGWEIWTGNTSAEHVFGTASIPAGGYAVVISGVSTGGSLANINGDVVVEASGSMSLGNTSDVIILYDPVNNQHIKLIYNGSTNTNFETANPTSTLIGSAESTTDSDGLSMSRDSDGSTNFVNQAPTPGIDNTGVLVTLTSDLSTGSEAGTTVITLTATANKAVSGAQTVDVVISGTGISGTDYLLSSSQITIADASTTGTVTMTIQDDSDSEGTEIATATISNPSAGVALGSIRKVDVEITDNDLTYVSFTAASASVGEADGTYDITVSITNPDGSNATTAEVALTSGDATDINTYTTQTVTFPAGSSADETVTLTITDDASYEGDETLTFTLQNVAGGLSAAVGAQSTFDLTITDNDPLPAVTLPYSETFDSDISGVYTYSVSGATKEWYFNSTDMAAEANGYNSGDTEEDWIILPGINLDNYTNEYINFDSEYQYGTDDANNYLKLMYSTDYAGVGDPSSATWTELSWTQPSTSNGGLENSGNVDLSSISGTLVYLALEYHYESGSYRRWTIDNITVAETPATVLTVTASLSDFGSVDVNTTSAEQTFTVEGTDLTGDITVTAPSNFEVSLTSGSGFGTSVAVSPSAGTVTTTTIFVRFAPTTTLNSAKSGDITVSTPGLTDETIAVTGTETGNVGIANDLIFSEYFEGASNNKYIEIYNASAGQIDLSNYTVKQANNGSGFDGATPPETYSVDLTGTLNAGDVYIIYNGASDNATILAEGDLALSYGSNPGDRVAAFNGDDALGLFKNGVLIDLFGDPENDPGSSWDAAGVSGATVNHTMVRKSTIITGNVDVLGSFGTDANNSEWIVLSQDDVSSTGSHFACEPPSTQATAVTFGTTDETSMVINWTQGNGDNALVVVKAGSAVDVDPESGVAYTPNTDFTSGEDLGSGNIVVYAGTSSTQTVTVTGLTQGTTYHVAVYEYNSSDNCYNVDSPAIGSNSTTTPNDTDSDITANGGTTADIDYASFQTASTLTDANSVSLFTFDINDKGTGDAQSTTLTDISFSISNFENLRTVALFDGTTNVAEMSAAATLDFTGLSLEAASGLSKSITVKATFMDVVDDQEQIQVTITAATADAAGSVFATADASGAASDISTANLNAIAVTATAFEISGPSSVAPSTDFSVTATAVDANGNTDIAARSVTLSLNSGTGNLSSATGLGPQAMTSGAYTWSDVQHDTEESITLDVTDGSITSASGTINVFTATGGVFISEYIEGSSNNKALEVVNNTGASIDLSEYKLALYSNGSATITNSLTLSDIAATLGNGEVVVVSNASATDANILAESDITSSVTFYNGDDAIALLHNDVVIDVIGEIGNDPGSSWAVAGIADGTVNHTLVRKSSVTEGNATNLASFGTDASDSEWEVLDIDVTSDLGSHTIDLAGAPVITVDLASFTNDFGSTTVGTSTTSSSFSVSGTDLVADITVTAPTGFEVSLDDVTFSASVTLTQSAGAVSTTPVYARFNPGTVDAFTDVITLTSTDANDKTIAVSGNGLSAESIFFEDFSNCDIVNYNTISVVGAEVWSCTSSGRTGDGARMNGYNSGAQDNEDWLITDAIDLSSATNATLTFYTDVAFPTGSGLEILASSDYSGTGDPTSSTWTAFSALLDDNTANDTWVASGDIDLSSYVGGSVYIAFKYTSSTAGGAAQWTIDDILIEDRTSVANPSVTITESLTDFGSVDNGSVSASQSFTVEGSDLTADITITASSNFEVSLDDATFASSVAITPTSGSVASTTVHVRFAPASGINGALSGTLTVSTASANDQTINVSGTEAGNVAVENDLFFSEYIEGSSNNRAIEIYNGTGAAVDLSNYSIKQSHNGVGFDNDPAADAYDLPLSGTLAAGDVYVIYNDGATNATIIAEGDLALTYGDTGGARNASFTGDDAMGLFKNGVLIDVIGDPNNDPGTGWDVAGVTTGTVDHTLVRKETITSGNITPLGSFGTSTSDSEWVVLDLDDVSSIGSHTVNVVEPGFTLNTDSFDGAFGTVNVGEVSSASSYTVSGTEITGDFTVTIPAGFEASLTSDFSNQVGTSSLPLSITPVGGVIDNVTIFVRFAPDSEASFSGNLVNAATGYPSVNVAVTGEGQDVVNGLEDELQRLISVYPNPASKVLSVEIPASFKNMQVDIVSLEGAVVKGGFVGNSNQIDISGLRSGVYLLRAANDEVIVHKRVIIR